MSEVEVEFLTHLVRSPSALISGMHCYPSRPYGRPVSAARRRLGNPKFKPTVSKVKLLLHKRVLGFEIEAAARMAGWRTGNPAREIIRSLGWPIDIPRGKQEVMSSAVNDYVQGMSLAAIAKKYGFGTSTIHRWVDEAGARQSRSERKAIYVAGRPIGHARLGKKGAFHTRKGDRWIATDSTYEYARLEQLDADPDVIDVGRCDIRIPYIFLGKQRTYIPDFTVTRVDGIVVEEVKPLRWVNDPVVLAKASAAASYLNAMGIAYRVVSEEDIGNELIEKCASISHSRASAEYLASSRERRLAQRRSAQKTYLKRKRREPATCSELNGS